MIDQRLELARRLSLLLHATLSLLHWTLVKRRAINTLTLVDGAQFGLDSRLLGGLGALLVREAGHGTVRLHDLRQNLDVILTYDNGFDS